MSGRTELAGSIAAKKYQLADWVSRHCFEERPELKAKWGEIGFRRCAEDTAFHFSYLAEAVRFDFPILFTHYVGWTKILLSSLRIDTNDVEYNLGLLCPALKILLSPRAAEIAAPIVQEALEALPHLPSEAESFLEPEAPHYPILKQWVSLLLQHKAREARQLIHESVNGGVPIFDIYQHVFTPALHEVGRLWQTRQINEAEEHYCSHITQNLLALLSAQIAPLRIRKSVVGFCVSQEQHDIGIRLVTDCFALHGWDTVCLGSNVPTRNIEGILRNWLPDAVAISATMTYHLAEVQAAVEAIRSANIPRKPKIIVGGRPFNICPGLGSRIGVDATAQSCTELITCALQLL